MWAALRTPFWLARIVFIVGAVTVLSALLPAFRDRTHILNHLVPHVFPAAATTGAAAVGLMLIALSRALRRAKFRAWLLATILAAVGTVLHVIKGLDLEEAILTAALFVLLLRARDQFVARPDPRSLSRLAQVLVFGPIVATLIGFIWLTVDRDGQAHGTTWVDRLAQAVMGLVGVPGPVTFTVPRDEAASNIALVVLGASVLFFAILAALQPADGPHPLSREEEDRVRATLTRWGDQDSLGYFALRDDRSVIFSPSGKSALTYKVVGTVSLAAGDPLGDPEAWPGAIGAWLDEARSFGWVPAVLAASERGATAFHRAGLDALELGDEAILHVPDFTLEGRAMRVVRQAVARCERAGYTVDCRRVADLDAHERARLAHAAEQWRDGAVERGFSMGLGRFGEDRDGDALVVTSTDADGQIRGMLHMVPWGAAGLSLDLMRHDRSADNGVVEQMVVALVRYAEEHGVTRISLNFAVFRAVFARGERLGAGPVLRIQRSVLLGLSRFWQIESLYRANAKYQPEWTPRFVCFRSSADLPRVAVAALRAEAFLIAPSWLRRWRRV